MLAIVLATPRRVSARRFQSGRVLARSTSGALIMHTSATLEPCSALRYLLPLPLTTIILIHSHIVASAKTDSAVAGADVFTKGASNVSCYRIPSIVQVRRSGALVALAEARHGSCDDGATREIAFRRSEDGGRSWGPLRFITGGAQGQWLGNPAIVSTASGRLLLAVSVHAPGCVANCVAGNAVASSSDGGVTWSPLAAIENLGSAGRARAGPGLGLLVEQGPSAGRVLVPASTGTYGSDYIHISDDEGHSFRVSGIAHAGMDEAQATQLPNGNVLMIMRHTREGDVGKAAATSEDGGVTWSPIHYLPELKGPNCQASITSFGGSTWYSGPDSSYRRERLSVRRSDDSAQSWTTKLLLDPGCAR